MTAQVFDSNAYPYGAVVVINLASSYAGDPGSHGTGVLISPDEVLTANHVAYNSLYGVATNIKVAPAYTNDVAPFGVFSGTVTHYNVAGVDTTRSPTSANAQNDYAIIHLSKPVVGAPVMAVTAGVWAGQVHVTGYPGNAGSTSTMVDDVQTVSKDPAYSLYDGTAIGKGSSGGPVWTYSPDGKPLVVGLVSTEDDILGDSRDVQITAEKAAQIAAWVKQDDAGLALPAPYTLPVASLSIYDVTTKQAVADTLSRPFTGTLPYIAEQYVTVTPDSLNIVASSPNYFIHTGGGNDAVQLLGGTNVVDAGAGSNFLVSGTGRDTFYLDDRGTTADIWNTVSKFHSGDAATILGIGPSASLAWADKEGAPSAAGLTLHASAPGRPMASLTLAGFTKADLASGRITTSFGSTGGADYLSVQAT